LSYEKGQKNQKVLWEKEIPIFPRAEDEAVDPNLL
jgi:hypothetical protein